MLVRPSIITSFGLALLPPGNDRGAKDSVPSMPFEGKWVKTVSEEGATATAKEDEESFEIQYTAKEAGDFELHVWCDPDGAGKREWLPGSPFSVRVSGMHPSINGSDVGGVEAILSKEIVAGEEGLTLRPQLRDQFGNASAALEGS